MMFVGLLGFIANICFYDSKWGEGFKECWGINENRC